MDMIPLKPERKAQLEEYAKRRGQDPAAALYDALAIYLEWERQDFAEAAEGIRQDYEDVRAALHDPPLSFSPICGASMTFRIETSAASRARRGCNSDWLLSEHAEETGTRWFVALQDAIASLAEFPGGCPLAPENAAFPFEVRRLLLWPHTACVSNSLRD
jgi:hypothetical protein